MNQPSDPVTPGHDVAAEGSYAGPSAGHLQTILGDLPEAVITVDVDGQVTFVNGEAERLIQVRHDRAIGAALQALMPLSSKEAKAQLTLNMRSTISGGVVNRAQGVSLPSAQGSVLQIDYTLSPLHDGDEAVIGALMLMHPEASEPEVQHDAEWQISNSIVDTIRDPLLVLSHDLRLISANRAFYTTFHLTPELAVGTLFHHLCDGQWDVPTLRTKLEQVILSDEAFENYEVDQNFAGIGNLSLLAHGRKLFRPGSDAPKILLILEDITERKRREKQLREARDFHESIVETIRDPLLVLSSDLAVTSANRAFYHRFSYTPDDLLGQRIFDVAGGEWDIPEFRDLLENAIPDNMPFKETYIEQTFVSTGRRILLVNGRRLVQAGEYHGAILVSMTDMTEHVDGQQALRNAVAELKNRNQEMDQFVFTVSHDLKSPLVTVNGFIGLLEAHMASGNREKVDHALERIKSAADLMGRLIDDLLELSRIGRVDDHKHNVDMNALFGDLARQMQIQLESAGATLNIQPDLPQVVADRARMFEVFQNLISNAVKYGCPRPGMGIDVTAWTTDDRVCYAVRDNGPGVPDQYHDRIFRLFERLQDDGDGSGVGLAIVDKIIRVHKGQVEVENPPDGGIRFIVSLPRNVQSKESK